MANTKDFVVKNGLTVGNNITVSGTVDGRDIATDGSKLDGIESGATADQSASEILTSIKTVDGSGSGLDADLLDGVQGSSFLRSDANDTATGDLTFTGSVDHTGEYKGVYHTVVEDRYYFDNYNGARNVNAFLETQRSDIIRYGDIGDVEYWDGSAWQDASSQLSNVEKLLDGRQDTSWSVPSTYYKFRFTVTASTSWPTMALIGMQTSWTGSTYPGSQLLVEELQTDSSWLTKVTADFTSSNGITTWGTMFRADSALHTGRGSQTHATRITIDFDGWTPSNSSYQTIPLQNVFIFSNYAGTENNDYKSLLDYDRNINAPNNITVAGTVDGRDIATDGTKLDGIESGATADQTASEILTAIKTVDGSGSGLDADTLDGLQGSSYSSNNYITDHYTSNNYIQTYVAAQVASVVDSAPAALDTLNELAAALGDDANFSTTVSNQIGIRSTNTYVNSTFSSNNYLQGQLGTKLNSSSYTASDVLTKIKTVDGSGSGLDADLLDGISSASFLRSDAADTASGHLTLSAGSSSDGNGRFYSWRAVQNTSSQTPNYVRIARITGSQSQRVSIELTGSYAGYGDGTIASWGKLVGQLNNDNNYDFIFYDFKSGGNSDNSRVVEEIAQIDISTTETDIYVKVSHHSEISAFGYVSDGSITPYSDNITTTEPSNYSTITKIEVWNSNNDGSGSGLDADTLDGLQGSSFSSNNYLQSQLSTKLNSSSYTASDVLTKIKTVDGSGSGLDADTVDGIHASGLVSNNYFQDNSGGGATGGGSDAVFHNNDQTVTTNYSIPSGQNSMSAGPISINSGVTVTVPSGSEWTIV